MCQKPGMRWDGAKRQIWDLASNDYHLNVDDSCDGPQISGEAWLEISDILLY